MYNDIYSSSKEYRSYCPSNIFFIDRIYTRLQKWYMNSKKIKNTIIYYNNEKLKKDYDSEYLKLVRNYIINPKGAESIQDIIYRIDLFFEYIKFRHNDNSQLLVVTHNGIMRIIKKYYMNENNNIDSEILGQLILKK